MLHNPTGNPIYVPLGGHNHWYALSHLSWQQSLEVIRSKHPSQSQPSQALHTSKDGDPSASHYIWSHDFTLIISPNAYSLVTNSCVFFSLWLWALPLHTSEKGVAPSPLYVWGSKDSSETSHQPSLLHAAQTQLSQPHPIELQMYSSPMTTLVALCWTQHIREFLLAEDSKLVAALLMRSHKYQKGEGRTCW